MSRQRGWRKPPGAVYVGRPTRWGNPFRVDELGPEEAVARYAAQLRADPARVAEARSTLAGRDLLCWCALDQPCHADVLLAVANPASAVRSSIPAALRDDPFPP